MPNSPDDRYWRDGRPTPIIRREPNVGERFWIDGSTFLEHTFEGVGSPGASLFDLRLEVTWSGVCPELPWDKAQEMAKQEEAVEETSTTVVEEVAAPDTESAVPSAMDDSPEAARLYSDACLLERHVEALLEAIRLRTQELKFAVPPDAIEVRSTLVALHMSPDYVSFDDYLSLLRAQIDIAEQLGTHDRLNTATAQAVGQLDAPISFYENQLTDHISEGSAWATQAKPLVKTLQTSKAIQNYLVNYRKFGINNTILNALGGKASLSDIVRECIPCLERALNIRFNPFKDFLAMLQAELDRRWNYIRGLWGALNGNKMNICDLAQFLNGMCLPDLYALLAMLAYYWLQLMQILKLNIWSLLWSLLQPLLSALLTNLVRLIDQFIHLLLGPIRCIISSIDREYAKIYNLTRAFQPEFWTKGPSATKPYSGEFSRWAQEQIVNPVFSGQTPIGAGLLELKRALQNAEGMLNAQIKRIRDAIKEALGLDADALGDSQGLFLVLRWLAMVIALIKAFIKFKQDGFKCGPDGKLAPGQYQTLVQYLEQTTRTPVRIVSDSANIDWWQQPFQNLSNIPPFEANQEREFLNQLLERLDQFLPPLPDLDEKFVIPAADIQVPDCVALRSQLDAERTSTWSKELDLLVSD